MSKYLSVRHWAAEVHSCYIISSWKMQTSFSENKWTCPETCNLGGRPCLCLYSSEMFTKCTQLCQFVPTSVPFHVRSNIDRFGAKVYLKNLRVLSQKKSAKRDFLKSSSHSSTANACRATIKNVHAIFFHIKAYMHLLKFTFRTLCIAIKSWSDIEDMTKSNDFQSTDKTKALC